MSVVVDIGRDGCVVVVPLLARDDTVAILVAEAGKELDEDLFVGHLAALHLRVVARVIDNAQVGRGDRAVAVLVELCEGHVDDSHAGLIGGAADAVQELVVADNTVLVEVQVVEEELSLALGNISAEVLQAPVELLHVNLAITIVVHDFERAAHATDGPHAT